YSPSDTLLLRRQPSRWLGALLILLTLIGCVALDQSAMPALPALVCGLLLWLHCLWIWPRQVSLRHADSVTGLRFDQEGLHVLRGGGSEVRARLRAETFVSALLAVVRLREPGRLLPGSVILPADAVTEDSLRRLRLRLRFSR